MIISLTAENVSALDAGALLVLAWHSRSDGGQRFAPGKYTGEKKGRLLVTIRPFGEHVRNLSLAECDNGFRDKGGQEYQIKRPTEKELAYCKKAFGVEEETVEEENVQPMSAKEIALALLGVISPTARGTKKLCGMAGIEYSDAVPLVLAKLAEVGKISLTRVRNAEGKRVRRWALPE